MVKAPLSTSGAFFIQYIKDLFLVFYHLLVFPHLGYLATKKFSFVHRFTVIYLEKPLSKFLFVICILGIIICVYLVIDSIKKQEWGDAFVGITLGLACFANPLYEGIIRYKR